MKFYGFLIFCFAFSSHAGRPVSHQIQRSELITQSSFVFSGWPSQDKPIKNCAKEIGRWWVHKVLKGDKSLEGKVIALADHRYDFQPTNSQSKGVSYSAQIYKNTPLDKSQGSSFLFTNPKSDGCFELVATGAQEPYTLEPEITALFAEDCPQALRGWQFHTDQTSKECQQDSDCQIFYIHPNSCEKPLVLNKKYNASADQSLLELQSVVRKNCGKNWESQPACSPEIFSIRCHKNKCQEGTSKSAAPVKFSQGTIQSACAPHDASSVMILLKTESAEFPVLSVNWWGADKFQFKDGTYALKGKPTMTKGFQTSFCLYKGSCQMPKEISLKIKWNQGSGQMEYLFQLEEDEKIEGQVPLLPLKSSTPVLCG